MNKFEEMNVTEQQEINGGSGVITGPVLPNPYIVKLGAFLGATSVFGAVRLLLGK